MSLSTKPLPQARHLRYRRVLLWRHHWLSPYTHLLQSRRKQNCAVHLLISATAPIYKHFFLIWTSWTQEPWDGFSPWGEWDQPQTWSQESGFGRMLEVELSLLTFWYGQLWRFRHLIGMLGEWNSWYMSSQEEPERPAHNWLHGLLDYPTWPWNTSGTFVGAWMCWSGFWRLEYSTQPVGTAAWSWAAWRWCMDGWSMETWKYSLVVQRVLSNRFTKSVYSTFFLVILAAFDSSVYQWKLMMHWSFSTHVFSTLKIWTPLVRKLYHKVYCFAFSALF